MTHDAVQAKTCLKARKRSDERRLCLMTSALNAQSRGLKSREHVHSTTLAGDQRVYHSRTRWDLNRSAEDSGARTCFNLAPVVPETSGIDRKGEAHLR